MDFRGRDTNPDLLNAFDPLKSEVYGIRLFMMKRAQRRNQKGAKRVVNLIYINQSYQNIDEPLFYKLRIKFVTFQYSEMVGPKVDQDRSSQRQKYLNPLNRYLLTKVIDFNLHRQIWNFVIWVYQCNDHLMSRIFGPNIQVWGGYLLVRNEWWNHFYYRSNPSLEKQSTPYCHVDLNLQLILILVSLLTLPINKFGTLWEKECV